jgi:hypothetical protein
MIAFDHAFFPGFQQEAKNSEDELDDPIWSGKPVARAKSDDETAAKEARVKRRGQLDAMIRDEIRTEYGSILEALLGFASLRGALRRSVQLPYERASPLTAKLYSKFENERLGRPRASDGEVEF